MKPEESREWQSPLLTLKERGSHLLKLGLWTDCVFLVGPDRVRIAAHKLFLAISSPVFEAMFFGGMAEGNEPIPTPDVQPEAFRTLLNYVYTEDVTINSFEDACDVFYAAKKYMMTGLISQCRTHLFSKVSTSNVCHALELASMFDDNGLLELCKVILSKQTSTVLEQKSFLEAHPSTLVKIFSLDQLNIKDELDLLIAVEKYAEARGLKRSMIDGAPEAKRARYDESLSSETSLVTATEETTDSDVLDEEDMKTLQRAVQQIRLLTVPVVELARHAPHCVALPRRDALSLLCHALCDSLPPPTGFCLRTDARLLQPPKPTENQQDQKAEVSIQLTVLNFKTRKRRLQSEAVYVHGLPWYVQVVPGDDAPKTLGLFVKCALDKAQGSCKADVTIKLRGVPPKNNHKIKKFTHVFSSDVHTQGYAKFAAWSEACDTGLYSHGNTVVVEVHIAADRPAC